MKNVKGQEIPIDTTEDRKRFYLSPSSNFSDPFDPAHRYLQGKDTVLKDKLIPWCVENNVKTFIDVGADWGKYSVWLYEGLKADKGTAFEINSRACIYLDRIFKEHNVNINVICDDIITYKGDLKADLIFAQDVIEHIPDYMAVWCKLLSMGKYIYALIPKEDSFNWSPDHVHRFDNNIIGKLITPSRGLVFKEELDHGLKDHKGMWYSLLVRGNV